MWGLEVVYIISSASSWILTPCRPYVQQLLDHSFLTYALIHNTASPPASLSAVHETPTSIHIYWTPPVSDLILGYVIVVQSNGRSDISVSVSEWQYTNHTINTGIDANVDYFISLRAAFHLLALATAGPVIAARGEITGIYNYAYKYNYLHYCTCHCCLQVLVLL